MIIIKTLLLKKKITDPFIIRGILAGIAVALISGLVGCFVVWRRMSYYGESIAHSSLLGVGLGILMGIGINFGEAYAKAQKGANKSMPRSGTVFVSVKDSDKKYLDELVPLIVNRGFEIVATGGTASYIKEMNYEVRRINKVNEGRPHTVDSLLNNEIDLVINTTEGKQSIQDSAAIRRTALQNKIFCTTTMFGAFAIMQALESKEADWSYNTLQEINT